MCPSLRFRFTGRPEKYILLSAWRRELHRPGPHWQNRFLFPENSFSEELASYWLLLAFTGTALRKLKRTNYGRKWPVSIKYQNLHSFKEGLILLCQSILETRRRTHLHGSAQFKIHLSSFKLFLLPIRNIHSTFPPSKAILGKFPVKITSICILCCYCLHCF